MKPIVYIRKHIFGLTQEAFGDVAQTTQASVSRWETGELVPDHTAMAAIRAEARKRKLPWDDRYFFEIPKSGVAA